MNDTRVCFVHNVDDDDHILIRFKYASNLCTERLFNFRRSKDEDVTRMLTRIAQNINNIMSRKANKKKKKADSDANEKVEEVIIEIQVDDQRINAENGQQLTNTDVWREG